MLFIPSTLFWIDFSSLFSISHNISDLTEVLSAMNFINKIPSWSQSSSHHFSWPCLVTECVCSEFLALIAHRTIIHNVIIVHMTQSTMNVDSTAYRKWITPQFWQNGDYKVHTYLITTCAHLKKINCGLVFNKKTHYWLLQEMCHVAMATSLFY